MSSRYLKDVETKKTIIIHVYRNGDSYTRAAFIILRPIEQQDLERIIKAIEEKVRLPLNRPIRKLFEISGVLVTSCMQVEDGKYYVAASAENFFPMEYGKGISWVMVGPVRTSKYANVRFISRSEDEGNTKSLNSSNNMMASSNETGQKETKQKLLTKCSLGKMKNSAITKSISKKGMAASEHKESPTACNQDVTDDIRTNESVDENRSVSRTGDADIQENKFDQTDQRSEEMINHLQERKCEDLTDEDGQKVNEDRNENIEISNDNVEEEKDKKEEYYNESGANEDENSTMDNAATRIQASFRGYRVRNELEKRKDNDKMQDVINDTTDIVEEINPLGDNI